MRSEELADLLDKTVKPKRRLTEKTALAQMGVVEAPRRLVCGQAWTNKEFKGLEFNLQAEVEISTIDEMDTVNAMLQAFLQEAQVAVKKIEMEAIQSEAEGEEVFLQTRTISEKDLTSMGAALREQPRYSTCQ